LVALEKAQGTQAHCTSETHNDKCSASDNAYTRYPFTLRTAKSRHPGPLAELRDACAALQREEAFEPRR